MLSVNTLVHKYEALDEDVILAGRRWYPDAFAECKRIASCAPPGVGPVRVAGVVAAVSPQKRWDRNKRIAEVACLAAARRPRVYVVNDALREATPQRRALAVEILLNGKHPRSLWLGPKCDAFWRAIVGNTAEVVVDRHVARTMGLGPSQLTPRRIAAIADRYTTAAGIVGESPRDLQAILWVAARGTAE